MPKAVMDDWLRPSECEWTHEGASWVVTLNWREVDGVVECVGFALRGQQGQERPVRAATLRAFPLGRLIRDARRARYEGSLGPARDALEGTEQAHVVPADPEGDAWRARGTGRRPALDEDHFLEVARVYSAAVHRGGNPRKAVATALITSDATASRWIARARELAYLPPTSPGKSRAQSIEESQS